jgi:hypothetical protein
MRSDVSSGLSWFSLKKQNDILGTTLTLDPGRPSLGLRAASPPPHPGRTNHRIWFSIRVKGVFTRSAA